MIITEIFAAIAAVAIFAQRPLQDQNKIEFALARGSAAEPSAVFPLSVPGKPIACWWDDEALHLGGETLTFKALGIEPKDGSIVETSLVADSGRKLKLVAKLKETAAAYRVGDFGILGNQTIEKYIDFTAKKDGRLRYFFNAVGARSPRFIREQSRAVKAGDRLRLDIKGTAVDSGNLIFNLFDSDLEPLFMAFYPFHDPAVKVAYIANFTDRAKEILSMKVDQWLENEPGCTMTIRFADFHTGEDSGFSATTALEPKTGKHDVKFDIKSLKGGVYKLLFTVKDAAGREILSDYAWYAKETDGRCPWTGVAYGAEDTVPPPWTAPDFAAKGFTCWNRTIGFGRGLVDTMVSAGEELLAAPVELVWNGRPLEFEVELVRRGVSDSDYRFRAKNAPVTVEMRAEFDGFMLFRASFEPPVDSLELRVPIRRERVLGFDDCSDPMKKLALPKGTETDFGYDPVAKPWWWIGSATSGLMGGLQNVRGWYAKNLKEGFRLKTDAERAVFTMKFVDTPCTKPGKRTVEFYLEPTPVKPKDVAFAMTPRDKLTIYTGSLGYFFDVKMPGLLNDEKIAKFKAIKDRGNRVFFYSGARVNSPIQPWWSRFADEWYEHADPCYFAEEVNFKSREDRDHGVWVTGCLNAKSFFEHKLHSMCWFLWNSPFEDMYMDLAGPTRSCGNHNNGCIWTDDFGRRQSDGTLVALRELMKRTYRELKKKNPSGNIIGHLQYQRTPSDVFFDRLYMGETYDRFIRATFSYYDILNPEMMQIQYASRSNEIVIDMLPQIDRAMSMYAPHLLKDFKPFDPEQDRVARHATAYFKIHDLGVVPQGRGAKQWEAPERALRDFGNAMKHYAYYKPGCPVSVSSPRERFIYAMYEGNGRRLLILLNDTDETVAEKISVKGLSATGEEILRGTKFDFTSGSAELVFGPREALFIEF